MQLVSFGKDSESSMFIICSFINKNKPQNDLWAETHAQLMLSIDYVGEQAAGLELTGLYIFLCVQGHQSCTGDWSLWERAHGQSGLDFQREPGPNNYTITTPTNEHHNLGQVMSTSLKEALKEDMNR